jgi:hemoglobin
MVDTARRSGQNNRVSDTPTAYDLIGGEDGVKRLVHRFYELMDTLPEAAACRAIHGPSLERSEEKLFEYLTGWLGGPQLFTDKYGAPMLRRRHLYAKIGVAEGTGWLLCFHQAWEETVGDPKLGETILPQIVNLARHMVNQ